MEEISQLQDAEAENTSTLDTASGNNEITLSILSRLLLVSLVITIGTFLIISSSQEHHIRKYHQIDNKNNNNNNNNNNNIRSLMKNSQDKGKQFPQGAAPTASTVTHFLPTPRPTSLPTMAPTVPVLGCRGDRFDNEGNAEHNNRLFAGQYVCSDDDDQRYMFGIDPETGNLIWRDTFTNHVKTYYFNEYHRLYQDKHEPETRLYILDKPNEKFTAHDDLESEVQGMDIGNNGNTTDDVSDQDMVDCEELIPVEESSPYAVSKTKHNCMQELEDHSHPTASPTVAPETVLDYYFSLGIDATFRIHRVQRTEDYQILQETVHWELPSVFDISRVFTNCLKTHDCPYMHLHQDGVMVLAWIDFSLSDDWLGWMEKNIRRCYDFNTTDIL